MRSYQRKTRDSASWLPRRGSFYYRYGLVLVAATLAVCCSTTAVFAQASTAATAIYGRGVHAYFAGSSAQAEQYFTQAIQTGSSDPRPYYFRAMLRLNQGRQFEAENDMRLGAAYEARNPGLQHSIGRALQRVQGPHRRTLEQFRRQARVDRLMQSQQRSQQRYEQLDRRGADVLRQPSTLPLTQPVQPPQAPGARSTAPATTPPPAVAPALDAAQPLQPAPAQPLPTDPAPATDDDPFGAPAPVTPAAPADDDPFGATPTPAPVPATEPTPAPAEADPFDSLPAPAEQPEAAETDIFGDAVESDAAPAAEPEMAEDDPFGADPPAEEEAPAEAEDDPFGEAAADEEMEAEDDPFGDAAADDSAASDDDPFGGDAEPAEEPAEEEPAPEADEDDPFGDPFGDDAAEEDAGSTDDAEMPEEEESAPASDEDDPFGEFGSISPSPAPPVGSPAGQMFFALGKWIGSGGQSSSTIQPGPAGMPPAGVVQADFELGPTTESSAIPAAAESASDEDPFAEVAAAPEEGSMDDVDPFGDF